MTKHSLKENYINKRKVEVRNKVNLINEQILNEQALLLENLEQGTEIIKALRSINFSDRGFSTLGAARDAAVDDIESILGGTKSFRGKIRNLARKVKSLGTDNPMTTSLAMASGLYNFFEDMTKYIQARMTGYSGGNVEGITIKELVTNTSKTDEERTKRLSNLENIVTDSFRGEGSLNPFNENWIKKYFKNNYKGLAQEIMNAGVGNALKLGQEVNKNLANAQSIGSKIAGETSEEPESTQGTTGSATPKSTVPSTGTVGTERSTKTGDVGSTENAEQKAARKKAEKIYKKIFSKFTDIPEKETKHIIAMLAYNDMLK